MLSRRLFRRAALAVLAASALMIAGLVLLHAQSLESVGVRLKPGASEPRDRAGPFGLGAGRALPDYRLRLRLPSGWRDLGLKRNSSAWKMLEFPVQDSLPLEWALELQLIEDDPVGDEVLEQVQVGGPLLSGRGYEFHLRRGFRVRAGLAWLAATDLGRALIVALTLAVLISLLGLVGRVGADVDMA